MELVWLVGKEQVEELVVRELVRVEVVEGNELMVVFVGIVEQVVLAGL